MDEFRDDPQHLLNCPFEKHVFAIIGETLAYCLNGVWVSWGNRLVLFEPHT